MGDVDVEDVMDTAGRARRLMIASGIAIACAVLAYGALYALARPDAVSAARQFGQAMTGYGGGAWKFVYYFTAVALILGFVIPLAVMNHLAKKKWQRERFPEARQIS